MRREEAAAYHIQALLNELALPGHDDGGLDDTPRRVARAYLELTSGYFADVPALFRTFEAGQYDEMVIVRDVTFASLCEHHMLPFRGVAHVAYIPQGRVVGLSKVARLVEAYARRLQIQERMTAQIADAMEHHLDPLGVAVVVEAEHLCMAVRGVRKPGSTTVTSALRGVMKDKPEARAEAMALLHGGSR